MMIEEGTQYVINRLGDALAQAEAIMAQQRARITELEAKEEMKCSGQELSSDMHSSPTSDSASASISMTDSPDPMTGVTEEEHN